MLLYFHYSIERYSFRFTISREKVLTSFYSKCSPVLLTAELSSSSVLWCHVFSTTAKTRIVTSSYISMRFYLSKN